MNITKVVIPAAGWGTRLLPFTKAVPKEMLPLLDAQKRIIPAISYIAQEAFASNVKNCIIISTPYKQAISNYFQASPELEMFLQRKNKLNLIDDVKNIIDAMNFTYIFQEEAKGLGHAVSIARNAIAQEFFGVILPDDIMVGKDPALSQLIRIAQQKNASVIAVQEVPQEFVSSYGIIAIKKQIDSDLFQVSDLIEKPVAKDAPSNLAIIGRYVLSSSIFKALDEISPSAGEEIQLTDAIAQMLHDGNNVFAFKIKGTRYDIGTPLGWLKANIELSKQ